MSARFFGFEVAAQRQCSNLNLRMKKIPSVITGVAGEYFVAAELSRRGYIASISLRNTRGIDIPATNEDSSRSITIQCKTQQRDHKDWILHEKCEDFVSETHFYVFVKLGGELERPRFYVVPSCDVAKHASAFHKAWLQTPGREGRKHVDNAMRKFSDLEGKYLDKWELLGLG